jgi:cell wall-associated NlpC family hydrolase
MDTTTIGRVTIFAVLATALTLSIGVALAEEDIFSYRDDYKIDTAKLSDDENAAYPYVQKYAEERHISPALLMAMAKQESGFDPNAVGDGGLAIGYMQIHWDAAYDAGYRSARGGATEDQKKLYAKEDWPTDGSNPDTNIKYGSGYLKIVYDQWKDSSVYNDPVKNAISAYNKGQTHGPDLSNQATYVSPILTYYGNYKSKNVASSTPTPASNPSSSGEDPRIAKAIGWAEKRIGPAGYYYRSTPPSTTKETYCQEFVGDAYRDAGASPVGYPCAKAAADALGAKDSSGTPPRGAYVFYEYGLLGHVGLSIGAGMIIHVPGANIKKEKYNKIGLTYIGWAYPSVTPPINSFKTAWEFDTPGDKEGWLPHNIEVWSVQTDGRFIINPGPTDPLIEQPYISLDATFYNTVNINMASNAPDGVGAIHFTTSDSKEFSEDKKVDFKVNNDGDWYDYSIFMGSQPSWTGTITRIRIDPADYGLEEGEVDSIGFDYIRVEHSHIILAQSIYPNTASAGDELTFVFNIDNPFSNEISKVRLGARIRTHEPQGGWIDDMSNDNITTLKPGANDYSRAFKTPSDLSDGLYDAEWVIMDEGTKRWIDHENMCPILTISSNSPPNPTPTSAPTAMPTGTVSPTPDPTPPANTEVKEVINGITSVVEGMIQKILDMLESLL